MPPERFDTLCAAATAAGVPLVGPYAFHVDLKVLEDSLLATTGKAPSWPVEVVVTPDRSRHNVWWAEGGWCFLESVGPW